MPPYDLCRETYDVGNWTINKNNYDEFNQIIMESGTKQGCIINDMRSVYVKYAAKDLLEEDGVHLNKKGHYILAESLIDKLIRLII